VGQKRNEPGNAQASVILIVECNQSTSDLLASLISPPMRVEVATTCFAALDSLDPVDRLRSLVVDTQLPDGNGLEVAEKVRQTDRQLPITIVTDALKHNHVNRAFHLGARFVCKPFDANDLVELRNAMLGHIPYSSARIEQYYSAFSLSGRQQEILSMVPSGIERRNICKLLNISESTLKWHIRELLKRTACKNLGELIRNMLAQSTVQ
jgi:DNA-binding NarL/FixJ family response regulator